MSKRKALGVYSVDSDSDDEEDGGDGGRGVVESGGGNGGGKRRCDDGVQRFYMGPFIPTLGGRGGIATNWKAPVAAVQGGTRYVRVEAMEGEDTVEGPTSGRNEGWCNCGSEPSSELGRRMMNLNKQFSNAVQAAVEGNPGGSLVPIVKDYLFYSRELLEHFKSGGGRGEPSSSSLEERSFKRLGEYFENVERIVGTVPAAPTPPPEVAQEMQKDSGISHIQKPTPRIPPTATTAASTLGTFGGTMMNLGSSSSTGFSVSPDKGQDSVPPFTWIPPKPLPQFCVGPAKEPSTVRECTPPTAPGSTGGGILPTAGLPFLFNQVPKIQPPAPQRGEEIPPPGRPSTSPTPAKIPVETLASDESDDEEETEAPKENAAPVQEENAIYSIRCKVYEVQAASQIKYRGVGTLFLKKLGEEAREKHQVVVRSDNSLGTIILNILLDKKLPLQKKSKDSILTADVHGGGGKGVPIIIRVSSEQNATELLAKLKACQEA